MPEPNEVSVDDVLSGTDLGLTSTPAAGAAGDTAPTSTSQAKDGGTPGASVPHGTDATGAASAEPNDFDSIPELKAAMSGSPAPGSTEEGGTDTAEEGEGAVKLSDARRQNLPRVKRRKSSKPNSTRWFTTRLPSGRKRRGRRTKRGLKRQNFRPR